MAHTPEFWFSPPAASNFITAALSKFLDDHHAVVGERHSWLAVIQQCKTDLSTINDTLYQSEKPAFSAPA
jgi:hypothetical protein